MESWVGDIMGVAALQDSRRCCVTSYSRGHDCGWQGQVGSSIDSRGGRRDWKRAMGALVEARHGHMNCGARWSRKLLQRKW